VFEWRELPRQDPRFVEGLQSAGVARDVELVPRRAVERSALVRPNLRRHPVAAQEAERAPRGRRARHVEVHGNLPATSQMHAAGGVEET
jgi:hypothetical protein